MVLRLIALLGLITLISFSAGAQTTESVTRPMYLVGLCMERENLDLWMEDTGEQPLAEGFGFVEEATRGHFPQGILTVWVNPETWTYTISIEFADGINCLLTAGENFTPAQGSGDPT